MALQCAGRYAAEDRHHLRETLASPDRARLPLDQSDADAEQDLTSLEEQAVPDPQHRLPRHTGTGSPGGSTSKKLIPATWANSAWPAFLATDRFNSIFHQPVSTSSPITSGYATWFTAGGAIRIAHYDVIDDVIAGKLYEIEKNGDHLAA